MTLGRETIKKFARVGLVVSALAGVSSCSAPNPYQQTLKPREVTTIAQGEIVYPGAGTTLVCGAEGSEMVETGDGRRTSAIQISTDGRPVVAVVTLSRTDEGMAAEGGPLECEGVYSTAGIPDAIRDVEMKFPEDDFKVYDSPDQFFNGNIPSTPTPVEGPVPLVPIPTETSVSN